MSKESEAERLGNVVKEKLQTVAGFSSDQMLRNDLGSELNFGEAKADIERTFKLYAGIPLEALAYVPYEQISALDGVLSYTISDATSVRDLVLTENPVAALDTRKQLIRFFRDRYQGVFNAVLPIYSIAMALNLDDKSDRLRERIEKTASASEDHLRTIQNVLGQVKEVSAEISTLAEKNAISKHAIHFSGEADSHEASAKLWLWVTAAFAGATVYASFFLANLYFDNVQVRTDWQNAQLSISKLAVISLLVSLVFWCARNFRAHKHNATVNRHRQNALATFHTFVASASDDQTKNAVLLQATQSIFAPQPTGYSSSDNETPSPTHVMEIIRSSSKN